MYMKKYKTVLFYGFALVVLAGIFYPFLRSDTLDQNASSPLVSVILYEGAADQWVSLGFGIQQACGELDINVPITKLSDRTDPAQQKALIDRELEDGAQGLIIAGNNSAALLDDLEDIPAHVPVVLVEPVGDSRTPTVSLDDAEMGQILANGLVSKKKNVIVLKENMHRQNVVLRYEAFKEQCAKNGTEITEWESSGDNVVAFLTGMLSETPQCAIVAFDPETLENIIDAALAVPKAKPSLYGIGASEKILYYLDRQLVLEICFGNEFGVGFNGMITLAKAMGLKPDVNLSSIDSMLVRKDNLYNTYLEQLLFPIIR